MNLLPTFLVSLLAVLRAAVTAVEIDTPSSVVGGQNLSIKWDLDGGNFTELNFNLNWAGAPQPLFLTTVNTTLNPPVGETNAAIPVQMPAGPYHIEAVWPVQPALVGIGPIFSIMAPNSLSFQATSTSVTAASITSVSSFTRIFTSNTTTSTTITNLPTVFTNSPSRTTTNMTTTLPTTSQQSQPTQTSSPSTISASLGSPSTPASIDRRTLSLIIVSSVLGLFGILTCTTITILICRRKRLIRENEADLTRSRPFFGLFSNSPSSVPRHKSPTTIPQISFTGPTERTRRHRSRSRYKEKALKYEILALIEEARNLNGLLARMPQTTSREKRVR